MMQHALEIAFMSGAERKFWDFHNANPHVYKRLKAMALDLKMKGFDRYSIKGLWEVLRWREIQTTGQDGYKLNNNLTSYYARLLMEKEPALEGFFQTRRSKADG